MEIRLKVEGMTCGGCKAAVERVLAAQDGVSAVSVDLAAGTATVEAGPAANAASLAAAVTDAGYDARPQG